MISVSAGDGRLLAYLLAALLLICLGAAIGVWQAEPSWAAAGLKKTDGLEMKVRALLAERLQRIGYERQLDAAVSACR